MLDIERLKQNIERLENEKQKYERQNINTNEWIEKFKEKKGFENCYYLSVLQFLLYQLIIRYVN